VEFVGRISAVRIGGAQFFREQAHDNMGCPSPAFRIRAVASPRTLFFDCDGAVPRVCALYPADPGSLSHPSVGLRPWAIFVPSLREGCGVS
jgi:hypothetical protein